MLDFNMMLPFKNIYKYGILVILIFLCLCYVEQKPEEPFPPVSEKSIINEILIENSIRVNDINEKLIIEYKDWPNEYEEVGYTILLDDSSLKKITISATINKLKNSIYFNGIDVAYSVIMTIDSIEIVTDSVIIMPLLDLSDCNLTHLPKEIGKLRVRTLNIRYNYNTLQSLPDELMQLSEKPIYWDSLTIIYDVGAVNGLNTVSNTLKNWLAKHAGVIE